MKNPIAEVRIRNWMVHPPWGPESIPPALTEALPTSPLPDLRLAFHSTRDAAGGANHLGSHEEERLDAGRRGGLDFLCRLRRGTVPSRAGRGDVRGWGQREGKGARAGAEPASGRGGRSL